MSTVKGRNIVLSMYVTDNYYPIFCAKTMSYDPVQDEVEKTSINSGSSREYEAGMFSATVTCTGIQTLNNSGGKISVNYLGQQSVRRQKQQFLITQTDDDGNSLIMSFDGIIISPSFSRDTNGFGQSSVSIRVTGDVLYDSIILPPVPEEVFSDYFSCTEGQSSISDASLEDVEILQVARSGDTHEETTGTPGNHQFKYTSGTGTVLFDVNNPFNDGEWIYVEWKE